jgi:hypothetical protein
MAMVSLLPVVAIGLVIVVAVVIGIGMSRR